MDSSFNMILFLVGSIGALAKVIYINKKANSVVCKFMHSLNTLPGWLKLCIRISECPMGLTVHKVEIKSVDFIQILQNQIFPIYVSIDPSLGLPIRSTIEARKLTPFMSGKLCCVAFTQGTTTSQVCVAYCVSFE